MLIRNVHVEIISPEMTANVSREEDIAKGEGEAQGCERRQTQLWGKRSEAGQQSPSGRLVQAGRRQYAESVGFREDAAERKLWKTGLEQWLSNLSVQQEGEGL